jgi:hypothetical protein
VATNFIVGMVGLGRPTSKDLRRRSRNTARKCSMTLTEVKFSGIGVPRPSSTRARRSSPHLSRGPAADHCIAFRVVDWVMAGGRLAFFGRLLLAG